MSHPPTEPALRPHLRALAGVAAFAVDERRVGGRAVLSVAGEVDVNTAARLRAAIENAGATASEVWLDFTETTFMDSSGVHAVVDTRCRLAAADCRLMLICPEGPVRRILRLTRVDETLEIHPGRGAALLAT